jgi:predicted membrane protein
MNVCLIQILLFLYIMFHFEYKMSTNTITIIVPTTNAFLTMKKQNKKTKQIDIESNTFPNKILPAISQNCSTKRDHSQTKHEVDIATCRNSLSFVKGGFKRLAWCTYKGRIGIDQNNSMCD